MGFPSNAFIIMQIGCHKTVKLSCVVENIRASNKLGFLC